MSWRSAQRADMQEQLEVVTTPLTQLAYEKLCPGSAELEKLTSLPA